MSLKGTRLRIVKRFRREQSYLESSSEGDTFQRESWSLFFHEENIGWLVREHRASRLTRKVVLMYLRSQPCRTRHLIDGPR